MRATRGGVGALLFVIWAMGRITVHAEDIARPPIESVDYDEHARFRVNGRTFFPILLYGGPTDTASLAQFREFGFNTLTCRPDQAEALPAQGFYAAVHGGKKPIDMASVFLALSMDSPALNFKKDVLGQTAAANAKTAAALPSRPIMNAIGYWEDEPAGVVAGKLPSQSMYDDLVAAIDVSAPYLYPVPYQPVTTVGDAVARARAATAGKKPVLPILQLFTWEVNARYPTPTELRCMTFLALVEGASGIGFYTYRPVTGQTKEATIAEVQPELWNSVKQLNREIAELGPLLLADAESSTITLAAGPKGVKFKSSGGTAGLPAVLVNGTAVVQEAQLVGPSAAAIGTIHVDGDRRIEMQAGTAALSLQPFEVVILRRFEKQ